MAATTTHAVHDPCAHTVHVFDGGQAVEVACPTEVQARGLTLVDLSDAWVPRVLVEAERGATAATSRGGRPGYVALADEQGAHARSFQDRYLELYGVLPTLRVLDARLREESRHACHDAVDDAALQAQTRLLAPYALDMSLQLARAERVRSWRVIIRNALQRYGFQNMEQLAAVDRYKYSLRRFRRDEAMVAAIEAVQAHLRCDGLLSNHAAIGVMDASTIDGLRVYQRQHVVIASGAIDPATRAMLLTDSRELIFRAALRVLRERVAEALGLIEDGSAGANFGQVLGRDLDAPQVRVATPDAAIARRAAPDLISAATEVAARELGWNDAQQLAAFLQAGGVESGRLGLVALRLPEPPAYHSAHMELRAEIDRGDVEYAFPYRADGTRRSTRVKRRPTLTLFARANDGWIALVRWSTTIGGWQPEMTETGRVGMRYKESPVGPRIWRDLIAAPAWLPPTTTPDSDLVRYDAQQRSHVLKHDLFGPGYRSAYGLTMLVHLKPLPARRSGMQTSPVDLGTEAPEAGFGSERFFDQGARTHGTAYYDSILRGYSHGCHRLFNHLALRLTGFLLAHRQHIAHGPLRTLYARQVQHAGQTLTLRLVSRGERYELTPPVAIEVLNGRVVGSVTTALPGLVPYPERAREP